MNVHVPLDCLTSTTARRRICRFTCVQDYEDEARLIFEGRQQKMFFDYFYGGAEDEVSLQRNKDAFKK